MHQNSKTDERESNTKNSDKQGNVSLLDERRYVDKPERETKHDLSQSNQGAVDKEQKNADPIREKPSVPGSLEKVVPERNERQKSDEGSKGDVKQKSMENKVNASPRAQLTVEEKRKSAPVKSDLAEEWTKPAFNKQSSLEENSRYIFSFAPTSGSSSESFSSGVVHDFRIEKKVPADVEAKNQSPAQECYKSLQEKRKSVEEKLNAVLEKRFSMNTEMRMSVSSMETLSHGEVSNAATSEKNIVKACSTEDVKTDYGARKAESVVKSHSEGSSRYVSLENFSDEFDGKRNKKKWAGKDHSYENNVNNSDSGSNEKKGSSVNVSVITSTPIRSRSVSRRGSGDNIVVITGKVNSSEIVLLYITLFQSTNKCVVNF